MKKLANPHAYIYFSSLSRHGPLSRHPRFCTWHSPIFLDVLALRCLFVLKAAALFFFGAEVFHLPFSSLFGNLIVHDRTLDPQSTPSEYLKTRSALCLHSGPRRKHACYPRSQIIFSLISLPRVIS
jgi:hypothetical protein